MTNAEAIETLRANYPDACYEQLREAVDVAIEALKARCAAGDTISRQAAINALDMIIAMNYKDWARAQNAIRQLPSAQIEQRWIPVTERLPEHEYGESTSVLTVDLFGVMRVTYFDGGNWCWPSGETLTTMRVAPITHWMPLPEPPKEE